MTSGSALILLFILTLFTGSATYAYYFLTGNNIGKVRLKIKKRNNRSAISWYFAIFLLWPIFFPLFLKGKPLLLKRGSKKPVFYRFRMFKVYILAQPFLMSLLSLFFYYSSLTTNVSHTPTSSHITKEERYSKDFVEMEDLQINWNNYLNKKLQTRGEFSMSPLGAHLGTLMNPSYNIIFVLDLSKLQKEDIKILYKSGSFNAIVDGTPSTLGDGTKSLLVYSIKSI